MADVVEKVRLHSDVVKRFTALRRELVMRQKVEPSLLERLYDCEVGMVRAQNDAQLLAQICHWLDHAIQVV